MLRFWKAGLVSTWGWSPVPVMETPTPPGATGATRLGMTPSAGVLPRSLHTDQPGSPGSGGPSGHPRAGCRVGALGTSVSGLTFHPQSCRPPSRCHPCLSAHSRCLSTSGSSTSPLKGLRALWEQEGWVRVAASERAQKAPHPVEGWEWGSPPFLQVPALACFCSPPWTVPPGRCGGGPRLCEQEPLGRR